jgi:hypothetical protein
MGAYRKIVVDTCVVVVVVVVVVTCAADSRYRKNGDFNSSVTKYSPDCSLHQSSNPQKRR